jgi:glycosyltransferase involved in cell wall biosynthesis
LTKAVIIIPALNEEKTISQVVADARAYGDVHVVDDGSSDQTSDVAREAGASVSRHPANKGYDGALDTGIAYALDNDYFAAITVDADGQLPVDRVPAFIALIEQGADIVVGDRGGGFPRWSETLFAFFGKRMLGLDDPFCGMKAYRLEYVEKVGVRSDYVSIGTGLTVRMLALGAKLSNIPIEVAPRDGASRMGSRIRSEIMLGKAAMKSFLYFLQNRK